MEDLDRQGARASVSHWTDAEGRVIVEVDGEIDISNIASVREMLDPIAASRPHHLVFDLSNLSFIDSSGLALFLAVAQQVETVHLRNPSRIAVRIIEATGLSGVLPTEP